MALSFGIIAHTLQPAISFPSFFNIPTRASFQFFFEAHLLNKQLCTHPTGAGRTAVSFCTPVSPRICIPTILHHLSQPPQLLSFFCAGSVFFSPLSPVCLLLFLFELLRFHQQIFWPSIAHRPGSQPHLQFLFLAFCRVSRSFTRSRNIPYSIPYHSFSMLPCISLLGGRGLLTRGSKNTLRRPNLPKHCQTEH